jgi:hypothetical protein
MGTCHLLFVSYLCVYGLQFHIGVLNLWALSSVGFQSCPTILHTVVYSLSYSQQRLPTPHPPTPMSIGSVRTLFQSEQEQSELNVASSHGGHTSQLPCVEPHPLPPIGGSIAPTSPVAVAPSPHHLLPLSSRPFPETTHSPPLRAGPAPCFQPPLHPRVVHAH